MKVIYWKSKLFFHGNGSSTYMTKHNSIWSKALSMPLTIWKFVWSLNLTMAVTGPPLFATSYVSFATTFYTR